MRSGEDFYDDDDDDGDDGGDDDDNGDDAVEVYSCGLELQI